LPSISGFSKVSAIWSPQPFYGLMTLTTSPLFLDSSPSIETTYCRARSFDRDKLYDNSLPLDHLILSIGHISDQRMCVSISRAGAGRPMPQRAAVSRRVCFRCSATPARFRTAARRAKAIAREGERLAEQNAQALAESFAERSRLRRIRQAVAAHPWLALAALAVVARWDGDNLNEKLRAHGAAHGSRLRASRDSKTKPPTSQTPRSQSPASRAKQAGADSRPFDI
jgi:hypothetical protein